MSRDKAGVPEYWLDLINDTLKQLDVSARGAFLQKFFLSLVGQGVSAGESIVHWEGILARRNQWAEKLGCPVTLRTAVMVYFEDLGLLHNPVLLEYEDLKKLRFDAATDPLTGLNNRRMFEEHLHQEIDRSTRYGFPFALLSFDLYKFKNINDTYGHAAGDEMLRSVARASLETIRGSDIPCRIGGDEFAIILPQADRPGSEVLAERIARKFEAYARSLAPGAPIGIDYGIAVFPGDGRDLTHLLAAADRNLYANKQKVHDQPVGQPVPSHIIVPQAEKTSLQINVEPAQGDVSRPSPSSGLAGDVRMSEKVQADENAHNGRRFERIRMDGAPAVGTVRVAGKSCAVKILDVSRMGVGISIDQMDLPEVFQALLPVPILPEGELALQRVYSLPLPEGKRRVGCRLTAASYPK